MPVMDEFREERETIKNSSFKKKFQYFLDYYKWYVIGGAAIILFAALLIRDMSNSKDWALFGFFINTYVEEEARDNLINEFSELIELDTENYSVGIDDSLVIQLNSYDQVTTTSTEKIMVYMAAGDVDFMAADATTFEQYATSDTFFDATTILSAEQIEKYEPYFYYVDMEYVRQIDEATDNGTLEELEVKEYDHRKPEEMEDPVSIALYIDHSEKLLTAYSFIEEDFVFGVPLNTKHLDTTLQFIDFIFE